jgi:TolB-like protein
LTLFFEGAINAMKKIYLALAVFLFLGGCSSSPAANPDEVSLNTAIRMAASRMESGLDAGTKIALINFTSPSQAFSEYVLDELSAVLVNNKHLVVVDRANLDRIRQELGFNMSGEVSDQSMQEIGQMLGAQALVTGSLTSIADLRRLMFKVIMTETAAVTVQHNADIINDRRVQALLASDARASAGGGSQGVAYGGQGNTRVGGNTTSGTTTPATPATPPPPPTPTYRIGDTGPAGGLIFYDKGNSIGGWRYMEAAPANTERTLIWATRNMEELERVITTDESQRVGKGTDNTIAIMEVLRNSGGGFNTAIWYCDQLVANEFDDWFLPSWDELNYMYGNLYIRELGNFKPQIYWSSNGGTYPSGGVGCVYTINFNTGRNTDVYRDVKGWNERYIVRAARRF